LKPSASVLLPVFNAQHRLENDVAAILDVLAELTDRFDVLIVDDGSHDDTIEVARQLSIVYPQVSAVRHPLRLGLAEAVETALDQTDGDILFVGDEHSGIDPDDLRKLWPLRSERGLVMARPPADAVATAPWIAKLLAWTPKRGQPSSGVQMIRRREFDELRRTEPPRSGQNRRIDSNPGSKPMGVPARPIYLQKGRKLLDDRRPV
jgi:glycosyltransferase involved in cell wall biosynthesis